MTDVGMRGCHFSARAADCRQGTRALQLRNCERNSLITCTRSARSLEMDLDFSPWLLAQKDFPGQRATNPCIEKAASRIEFFNGRHLLCHIGHTFAAPHNGSFFLNTQ